MKGEYINILARQIIETSVILFIMSSLLKAPVIKSIRRVVLAITIFFSSYFWAKTMGDHSEGFIGVIVQIICINLLFPTKALKRNITYVAVYCGTGLITTIIYVGISKITGRSTDQLLDSIAYVFITYFILFLAVFFIKNLTDRFQKASYSLVRISLIDMLLFSLMTVLWALGITYFVEMRDRLVNPTWDRAMMVGTELLYVISFLVMTGYIWKSIMSKHYQKESIMNAELIELREEYYNKLIENNQEVRRFKHDFRAHMICLKELAGMEMLDKIKDYLMQIENEMIVVSNKFNVGNEIANIVLNEFYNKTTCNNIDLICTGKFRGSVIISSHELCALLYNMVSNAVEACMSVNVGYRVINLDFKSYHDNLIIKISNTISEPVDISIIERGGTSKEDKKNHGYGIANMKRIVQRYNGELNYKYIGDKFILEIILFNVYDSKEYE